MTFRDLISETTPLFLDHGLAVVDDSQNFIRYDSGNTTFTIAYDLRERSFYIHAGKKGKALNELNNQIVKDIFGEDYGPDKYQSVAENFISFLQGKGKVLLTNDTKILNKLDSYNHQRAKEFTDQIIRQQKIKSADTAWANKDYESFVQIIDLIGRGSLNGSYTEKYKIALTKVQ